VTSHVQPLDQGIIAATKAHYRRQMIEWILDEANKEGNADKSLKELTPNFYQMMLWLKEAWEVHVTSTTIRNCWRKSGLVNMDAAEAVAEQAAVQNLSGAMNALQQVVHEQGMLPSEEAFVTAEEYINLDGEEEGVHEFASEEELLQLVLQQGADQADSDEDENDEVVMCRTSDQQALQRAIELESYASDHPEMFSTGQIATLVQIRRKLEHQQLLGKRQTRIDQFFYV
jgi:DDE superfamily endonuclease